MDRSPMVNGSLPHIESNPSDSMEYHEPFNDSGQVSDRPNHCPLHISAISGFQ